MCDQKEGTGTYIFTPLHLLVVGGERSRSVGFLVGSFPIRSEEVCSSEFGGVDVESVESADHQRKSHRVSNASRRRNESRRGHEGKTERR